MESRTRSVIASPEFSFGATRVAIEMDRDDFPLIAFTRQDRRSTVSRKRVDRVRKPAASRFPKRSGRAAVADRRIRIGQPIPCRDKDCIDCRLDTG